MLSRAAVVVAVVAFALAVAAVPVSKRRLEAIASAEADTEADTEVAEAVVPNMAAPVLADSFHVKYAIFGVDHQNSLLPGLTNLIDRASRLIDGEAWQNVGADGAVTIKTITKPTLIGRIITKPMTQVWVKDHGWTLNADGKCTADTVNTQLVIPGKILRESGVFKGTIALKPILKVAGRKASKAGTFQVDQWDSTLPNGEGTVTYYLYHGETKPLMSNYHLTGKPGVWAQYLSFDAVTNPASEYAPVQACVKAAAAGAKTPATTTLAKLDKIAAAAHPTAAGPVKSNAGKF